MLIYLIEWMVFLKHANSSLDCSERPSRLPQGPIVSSPPSLPFRGPRPHWAPRGGALVLQHALQSHHGLLDPALPPALDVHEGLQRDLPTRTADLRRQLQHAVGTLRGKGNPEREATPLTMKSRQSHKQLYDTIADIANEN